MDRRMPGRLAILSFFLCIGIARLGAQSLPSGPSPRLSLSGNSSVAALAYQGAPLIFAVVLHHPNIFSTDTLVTPVVLNPQNGSWANTIQLAITDSNGARQNWPVQLVTAVTGALTLDQTNTGTLTWVLSPMATSNIAPGTYYAIAALNTVASAGTTGWSGATNSQRLSIQVSALPSTLTSDQQERQAELLATYDQLLGNDTQAVADINAFLTQQPGAVGALTLKGNLLAEMGQTTDALDAYDTAVAAFYAANPGPLPEQPDGLLLPRAKAESTLLSQTGGQGTPQVNIQVVNEGLQSPGVYFLDLQITNVGNGPAQNVLLNQLAIQVAGGTGQIFVNNVLSPQPPIFTDILNINGTATDRIYLSAQGTVSSFLLTEAGTTADTFGTPSAFSQTQTISGNFTGNSGGGTPNPLTITAGNATQTYGGAAPNLNNVTYTGFVNGDGPGVLIGSLSCATTAMQSSPVGSYPITCGGLSSPNYTITFIPGTLSITPASLTVSANDSSRLYGQANPAFTASVLGFVNGDTTAGLGGALFCTSSATASSPVSGSPYLIVCSGLTSSNYNIGYLPGRLNVTPAPLTITAGNQSRPYGQPNPAFTASYNGFVNGEGPGSLGGALTCTSAADTNSLPGTYPVTCSGQTSTNYAITYVPGQLTIGGVGLTITAKNASRSYGQTNPAFTASYNGFVGGDGPGSLTGTLTCTTAATAASPVGNYPINCSGLSSTSYSISYIPGQLTIAAAPLSITANNAARQYGQANPVFGASFSGFVNGDTPATLTGALSCTSSATASSLVSGSPYAINCSGLSSTNYGITYIPGQLAVAAAPLTITANNATRLAGQPNPAFSATFSGFVNGETASVLTGALSCTTTATASSPAGNYPIACSGLSSTNYAITYIAGQLTVTAGCAVDASSSIAITRSGFSYNLLTKRFVQTVTLKNSGGAAVAGPIYLVLDTLGANAVLYNSSGSTSCAAPLGSPYFSIAGTLGAGASTSAVLQFADPTNTAISYTTRVLSGAGRP